MPLLDLVEQHRIDMRRGRSVDVLGVAGDRDPGVLGSWHFDGGMLCQLGDHRLRVGVRSAVQLLYQLGNAQMGGLHPTRLVHHHHPNVLR